MADTAHAAPLPAPRPAPPRTAPPRTHLRPDFSTLGGLAIALTGILGGLVLEKGRIQDIAQVTAAMIVLGGTCGAVLVTTPLPIVLRAVRSLRGVFFETAFPAPYYTEQLISLAAKARKNGIVSLEDEAVSIQDPFLRKAMNLAVDGTDLQELRKMMEVDIIVGEQTREAEAKVWESAGGYSPTIGIIGAVLGLIQVMKHLEDTNKVGHGIAGAFVATVYGVGAANLFFLPVASKLRSRMRQAATMQEMILEGVVGIVEGLNPSLIRLKLQAFDPEPGSLSVAGNAPVEVSPGSPPPKPQAVSPGARP